MKIYLDTANLGEIREAARWGILSGVTTNPSLMAKEEGADFQETIKTIAELVDGPISAETISEDADGMVAERRSGSGRPEGRNRGGLCGAAGFSGVPGTGADG